VYQSDQSTVSFLQAVEHSLKSVRLFDDGIADKRVAKYSGGMKRRLSVAISLIGDPKVLACIYIPDHNSEIEFISCTIIRKSCVCGKSMWNAVMCLSCTVRPCKNQCGVHFVGCLHGRTKFRIGPSVKESTVECCDVCQREQGHNSDKYYIPPVFSDTTPFSASLMTVFFN